MTQLGVGADPVRVAIVTNAEQLTHAYAVRSICFMEETGLPADQAFDGNDFQATHIVVYAGREPIGATRLRWFSDFAKIERTAFRRAYRDPRILRSCAEFVFSHVAHKGYSKLVTHAAERHARVWVRLLGFERVDSKPAVSGGNLEPHVELIRHLSVPENAVTISSPPSILFRIEGAWDAPSLFG
jgi:hypothetical protein